MSKRSARETNTSWEEVTLWYDRLQGAEGSEYHQEVILPGIERMLRHRWKSLTDLPVLDLACGQGVVARYLAERGAKVTAIDLSPAMLKAARGYPLGEEISYIQGDVTQLREEGGVTPRYGLRAESFAAATLVLAVQNLTPLSSLWRGVHMLLQPGGVLLVVMLHPCFRVPGRSDWQWNQGDERQERVLWQYLQSQEVAIALHPGQEAQGINSPMTAHFHRPLQAYLNTLGNAGLWLDHLEEWCSHKKDEAGPKHKALAQARREFPLFLALRVGKV
ncbi:MAG: methyltransferase domain-containing protein [Symbiobacteriaceae bacterium]|nr:methyltransferase domain-containing protein [Symbiobacteriaceae bacterium]